MGESLETKPQEDHLKSQGMFNWMKGEPRGDMVVVYKTSTQKKE